MLSCFGDLKRNSNRMGVSESLNYAAKSKFLPGSKGTRENPRLTGGGGGIRTPETLSSLTVFKTAGFNRSPTPPLLILTYSVD